MQHPSKFSAFVHTMQHTTRHNLISHSSGYHFHTDETQIYISFDSLFRNSSAPMLLSTAFEKAKCWMVANQLLLNPSKTAFLLLGPTEQLKKFEWLKSFKLGGLTC